MHSTRERAWLGAVAGGALLALGAGGAGCVGSEGATSPKDSGTGATTPGSSSGGSGQTDSGETGDDASSPPVGGRDAGGVDSGVVSDAETADAPAGCTMGALKCSGNVPQVCMNGAWENQTACGGAKPLCSNGVCGTYIVSGGVRSTAPPAPAADAGGVHLVAGGFEFGTRACTEAGVCVAGGIVP